MLRWYVVFVLQGASAGWAADVAAPAQTDAANPNPAPRGAIEEIVIEGERNDQTLQTSSHSVAVFSAEQLQSGTSRNMDELVQRVANVTVAPGTGELVVRGVAEDGVTRGFRGGFSGHIPNIVNFADGFFTPSSQSLWDARQVEVARGPENFTAGGVIGGLTAVSSNAVEDRGNLVSASWSPDPNDRSAGVAYGARLNDNLGYRVAGYTRSRDGSMENTTRGGNDWNSYDETMGRIRLDWRPASDDATNATLRIEHLKTTEKGGAYIVSFDPDIDPFDRETAVDTPERVENETASVLGLVTHRFDARWHMEGRVGWTELHTRETQDFDGTDVEVGRSESHFDGTYTSAQIRVFYDNAPWRTFFRQYVLHLDVSNPWSKNYFPFDLDDVGPVPGSVVNVRYSYSTPNWWFVGTQFGTEREFGRLTLSASLAHNGQILDGTRAAESARFGSTGDPDLDAIYDSIYAEFFPQAHVDENTTEFNWLPSVDADFAATDAVNVGAKYERGARLGGLWFNPARGTVNRYNSEHSDSFDVYLRWRAFDERLAVRLNAFYTRFTDQQIYAALSDTPLDEEFVNAQRAHNTGLEIESNWSDGNWSFWSSAGLLNTQFDRMVLFDDDFSGNDFPDAPDWTFAFGFQYQRVNGLFVSVDATLRPESKATIENTRGVVNERQHLVNGRIGWTFERVDISVYGRNIFDEKYLTYRDKSIDPNASVPTMSFIVGAPRELGLTVSVEM